MKPLCLFQIYEHETQSIENLKAYLNHTIEIHRYPTSHANMLANDSGLFYCELCMCYHTPNQRKIHNKKQHDPPTLKELFNKQQLTGYLETAQTKPLESFT